MLSARKRLRLVASVNVWLVFLMATLCVRAHEVLSATCPAKPVPLLESNGLKILSAFAILEDWMLSLVLVVQNCGDEDLTIPTANLSVNVSWGVPTSVFQMSPLLLETREGAPLVRSIYSFEPIRLRPGEVAEVIGRRSLRGGLILDEALEGKAIIGFSIGNDEAKRFELWQGQIFSDPVELYKPPKHHWWQRAKR